MLKIQKLARPTKRSGFALKAGGRTTVRGLTVVNQNSFTVYVDKFTRKKDKKRKKR